LLNIMLGSVQTSRIIANVRERHGYSYNVSSRLVRRPGSSQWALTADVANDVTGAALREILAELARVVAEPPSDEELRRHQAFLAGVLISENATPAGILDTLRSFDLYGVPAEYRANFVERTRDVAPADIQRVARKYFQPYDLVIVVVGDRAAVASQLASIGELTD
jgi:zinc protease